MKPGVVNWLNGLLCPHCKRGGFMGQKDVTLPEKPDAEAFYCSYCRVVAYRPDDPEVV